jgi:AcrR family transcriptional regulator
MSTKALVGALADPEGVGAKPRVRDRIFRTACDLFYRHGIRAVGVDTIATEAGTNKMSFYRSFESKDVLVAEYLRDQVREGWKWWDSIIVQHPGQPRAQVEALFDAHVMRTCVGEEESRGCALANAAVEIPEADHPARRVVEEYKQELRERFRELARQMHSREPAALGDALLLLFEGSYLTRLTFHSEHGPAESAAAAARALMSAYAA